MNMNTIKIDNIEHHTRSSNFGQESHRSVLHFTATRKFFLKKRHLKHTGALIALEQLACDGMHLVFIE